MIDAEHDVSTFPDLDPTFAEVHGTRAVAEAIARRLMTPRGTLDYDPDYGFDVRELLSAAVDERRLFWVRAEIEAEAEKDERVRGATATLERTADAIVVTLALETAEGPFRLTLGIDDVTVAILSIE